MPRKLAEVEYLIELRQRASQLLQKLGREAEWHEWEAANRLSLEILAINPQADGQSMAPPGWVLSRGAKHNNFTMPQGVVADEIKTRFEGGNEIIAWVAYLHFLWVAQADGSPEEFVDPPASQYVQSSMEAQAALLREELTLAETTLAAERDAHETTRRAYLSEVGKLQEQLGLGHQKMLRPTGSRPPTRSTSTPELGSSPPHQVDSCSPSMDLPSRDYADYRAGRSSDYSDLIGDMLRHANLNPTRQ